MSNLWQARIDNANKYYNDWQNKFKCNLLEEYYEGFQWKGKNHGGNVGVYNPYVINLFYSTIKIKLASLLFQKPSFILSPRPGNSEWNLDFAVQSAAIKQDALNAIISNPNTHFVKHLKLAALDSFFRFGLIEVGYAADWRNPAKEPPLLSSWNKEDVSTTNDRVIEDNEVPLSERCYVKRIPPARFRCCVSETTDLSDHEWCGYYEYFYTNELKKTKGIKWPKDASTDSIAFDWNTGTLGGNESRSEEMLQRQLAGGSISKVWHIWDMVSHKRYLYLDGHWEDCLWEELSERLPLIDVRWDLRLRGWYPIPPAFQWISPQDEINEAREQTRSYRRRFTRKFQAVVGSVDVEEQEKFASGPDGIIIQVKQADAISPIENPQLGASTENALLIAKDDFNIISGTSAEMRSGSDRQTATQSKIIDARSQIRESSDQMDFSNFVCLIGREILATAAEKMVDGMWAKYTAAPSEGVLQDMQVKAPIFRYIKSQDLADGYDVDIEVDVQNATPAAMQQAQTAYITFISLIQKFPMLSMSPILIRETAYRCGYRNERVIQQMQQTAVLSMAAQAAQGGALTPQGAQGASPDNVAKTQVAQMESPDAEQIGSQLDQQLM